MAAADSKVASMLKALGGLEDELDTLDTKVADMKRRMTIKTQNEIESLYEKVRETANAEAETAISEAEKTANAEAKAISKEVDARIKKIQASIDAGFDDAADIVVSTILKP